MIFATMKRADINNEIPARICAVGEAVSFPYKTVEFARLRFHQCPCRIAAIFLPEVEQIITCFVRNTDDQIKKCERFDIRARFPASIAINRRKPQIRRIVKNRYPPRLSLFEKIQQSPAANIAEDVRNEKDIVGSNLFREIEPPSPEEAPNFGQWVLASPLWPRHCVRTNLEWSSKELVFWLAELCVKVACGVPANGMNLSGSGQLRKDLAGHPLHAGVLHRPAGTGHVDERFHSVNHLAQRASHFQKRRKIIGHGERDHGARYYARDPIYFCEQDRQREIQYRSDRAVDGHAFEMSRGIEQTT